MSDKAAITIGLPVYNGEKYLEEALQSILCQSFTDYQIIISDNASTDSTREICERYANEFAQIEYFRSETNQGAAWNFRHVFELSSSPYFKWMAHDDLIAPDYLEKCYFVLEANPDVVVAFPSVTEIDGEGCPLGVYSQKKLTDSPVAHTRFRSQLLDSIKCYEVLGVIRSDSLRRTQVMGNYGHADGVLLAQLSLLGKLYEIPEQLSFSRHHTDQSITRFRKGNQLRPDYHSYTVWFDPSKKDRLIFPNWRIFYEYFKSVRVGKIGFFESVRCHYYVLVWARHHRYYLKRDLDIALRKIVSSLLDSKKFFEKKGSFSHLRFRR